MKRRLFLLFAGAFLPTFLAGQGLFYKIYNHQDGLPSNTIYDIAVDRVGYVYLAMDCGIYRFNGRRFRELPLMGCKATTFTDLQFDDFGRLWARNFSNEIFCLQADTLRSMTQYFASDSDSLSISRLICADGAVYINNRLEILRFDLRTFVLSTVIRPEEYGRRSSQLWDFCLDERGGIYLKAENRFWLKPEGGQLVEIGMDISLDERMGEGRFGLVFGKVHYTPIMERGMYMYEWDELGNYERHGLVMQGEVKALRAYRNTPQETWFCSTLGLYRYVVGGEMEILLPKEYYATKVVQDFEGGYWVSTIGNGLVYIPSLRMRRVSTPVGHFTALAAQGEGRVLAGANHGWVAELDTSGQELFRYIAPKQNDVQFIFYDTLRERVYHTMGYHRKRALLAAGYSPLSKALLRLDREHMVVGAWNGAYVMHEDINKRVSLPKNMTVKFDSVATNWNDTWYNNYALLLRHGRVRAAWDGGASGLFFMAFVDGLFCFDRNAELKATPLLTGMGQPIYATSISGNGDTIWVGTFQQGVFGIEQSTKHIFAHYTTSQGLSSQQCNKLFLHKDKLWIITSQGIDLLHTSQNYIESASQKYAIETAFANDILVTNQHIWISSDEGLVRIDNKYEDISPPRLVVHSVHFDQKRIAPYPLDEITLGESGGELRIRFEAINFRNIKPLGYEYRISEGAWQPLDPNQEVLTISSFGKGSYTLEIRIKNAEPNLKASYYRLQFNVLAPFWLRYDFLFAVSAAFLIAIYGVTRKYIHYHTKNQRLREALYASQLSSLRARMNPHFLNNALNTIQALIQSDNKDQASDVIGDFSTLMRLVLNMSGKDVTTLADEIEALRIYTNIECLRFGSDLYVSIENDLHHNLSASNILLPSMIVQPIVENAIKHGLLHRTGEKEVIITNTTSSDNCLYIHIRDNGIGRKAAAIINSRRLKSHLSFATHAIKDRIALINQLHNSDIDLQTIDNYDARGQAAGTTVILRVPLSFR